MNRRSVFLDSKAKQSVATDTEMFKTEVLNLISNDKPLIFKALLYFSQCQEAYRLLNQSEIYDILFNFSKFGDVLIISSLNQVMHNILLFGGVHQKIALIVSQQIERGMISFELCELVYMVAECFDPKDLIDFAVECLEQTRDDRTASMSLEIIQSLTVETNLNAIFKKALQEFDDYDVYASICKCVRFQDDELFDELEYQLQFNIDATSDFLNLNAKFRRPLRPETIELCRSQNNAKTELVYYFYRIRQEDEQITQIAKQQCFTLDCFEQKVCLKYLRMCQNVDTETLDIILQVDFGPNQRYADEFKNLLEDDALADDESS